MKVGNKSLHFVITKNKICMTASLNEKKTCTPHGSIANVVIPGVHMEEEEYDCYLLHRPANHISSKLYQQMSISSHCQSILPVKSCRTEGSNQRMHSIHTLMPPIISTKLVSILYVVRLGVLPRVQSCGLPL